MDSPPTPTSPHCSAGGHWIGNPPLEAGNGQAFPVGFYPLLTWQRGGRAGAAGSSSRRKLDSSCAALGAHLLDVRGPAGECADRWGTASGLLVWRQTRPKRPVLRTPKDSRTPRTPLARRRSASFPPTARGKPHSLDVGSAAARPRRDGGEDKS